MIGYYVTENQHIMDTCIHKPNPSPYYGIKKHKINAIFSVFVGDVWVIWVLRIVGLVGGGEIIKKRIPLFL